MSKYRIIKLTDDTFVVQAKGFWGDWKTLNYFSYLSSAQLYLMRNKSDYFPSNAKIIEEC